jgi:hypothetical protein
VPRAAQARNQHHLRREAPCAQVGSPNPGSTKPAVEHLDRTLRRNPRAARSGRPSGAGNLRGPPSGPKPSPLQARISATPSYIDAAKSPITSQRSASCSPQNQRPTSPGLPRTGGEKSARGAFGSPRQPPAQPGRPSAWPTPSRNASPPGLTRSANRARTQPLVSALAARPVLDVPVRSATQRRVPRCRRQSPRAARSFRLNRLNEREWGRVWTIQRDLHGHGSNDDDIVADPVRDLRPLRAAEGVIDEQFFRLARATAEPRTRRRGRFRARRGLAWLHNRR